MKLTKFKTKKATIRILDEVNCIVIGLEPSDNDAFYDKFGPETPNARFDKRVKMGRWDGRIHFYSNGGKTYNQLLPDIIPDLIKKGYKINLVDDREVISLDIPTVDKDYFSDYSIELGPHQVDAVNAIVENSGGIVLAATGAGKSIICATLCDLYVKKGLRTIVIVPSSDLVTQGVADYKELGLDVGEYSGDVKDLNHEIIISTWQALQNVPTLMGMFQAAIVDECHGTTGKILKEIMNVHGAHLYIRVGVTGTLPEAEVDRLSVRVTLGDPQYTITAKQLIDLGWLATIGIDAYELTEDQTEEYKKWKKEYPDEAKKVTYKQYLNTLFPDYPSENAFLNSNKKRLEFISEMIKLDQESNKSNTLILVNGVKIGKSLSELIPNSTFVNSTDKKKFRKMLYDSYKDADDVVVIATAHLASTGLNIPRIFNLYLIDIGKSYIRVIQSVGRGLRKAHDKSHIRVVDISSNLHYSNEHRNKRLKLYKNAEYPYKLTKIDYNNF